METGLTSFRSFLERAAYTANEWLSISRHVGDLTRLCIRTKASFKSRRYVRRVNFWESSFSSCRSTYFFPVAQLFTLSTFIFARHVFIDTRGQIAGPSFPPSLDQLSIFRDTYEQWPNIDILTIEIRNSSARKVDPIAYVASP